MAAEVNTSIRKQYLIAGCLYFGQLLVGFGMGWTAPVFVKLRDPDQTPLESTITDAEASWIASVAYIGIIVGPYITGYFGNVVGRKPCLYFGGSMLVLSFLLLAVAKSLALIYVARIICGIGSGVLFVTNLVYIGELASTKIRGKLLTMTGVSNTQGILTVYTMGPYTSYARINWLAVFLGFQYLAVLFFLVPETAVYQVMKGKREEALANLTSLGRQDDIDEVVVKANDKPKPKMAQLTEIYTVKSNRRAAFIIVSLNIFTQLSGMSTVIAFVTVIFEMTGSDMDAHISTIVIGVTQFLASIIAPIFVDRIGRKTLLLASTAVCSLSLAALGTYFYLYNNGYPIAEDIQWVSLVSVMIFCVAYYYGMGIIPNTFIGEMFTDTCRGFGGTITVTVSWVVGFGVTTAFGYLMSLWGPSVIFWMFSGSCIIAFIFSIFFVPETKGKSLLEIQEILSRSWL